MEWIAVDIYILFKTERGYTIYRIFFMRERDYIFYYLLHILANPPIGGDPLLCSVYCQK